MGLQRVADAGEIGDEEAGEPRYCLSVEAGGRSGDADGSHGIAAGTEDRCGDAGAAVFVFFKFLSPAFGPAPFQHGFEPLGVRERVGRQLAKWHGLIDKSPEMFRLVSQQGASAGRGMIGSASA